MSLFDKNIISSELPYDIIVNHWFEEKITDVVKRTYEESLDQINWRSKHSCSSLRDVIYTRLLDIWLDTCEYELMEMGIWSTTTHVRHFKRNPQNKIEFVHVNVALNRATKPKHVKERNVPYEVDFKIWLNM